MSRFVKEFDTINAAQPLSTEQVLELLGAEGKASGQRTDAVACFLAGASGWEQALRELRGAFAEVQAGLNDGQSE